MRWTTEQLHEYEQRQALRKRGQRAKLQEQPHVDARPIDHKSKAPKGDGIDHPKFRISITLFYSDARRRDVDGAASSGYRS